MKIRLNFLMLVINLCSSESSPYDWHINTIDRSDTDFGDDLKMPTGLNKERQQDLLKFTSHTNKPAFKPDSFHIHFKEDSDNTNSNNENIDDVRKNLQNLLKDPIYKKHQAQNDFQSALDQDSNHDHNENYSKNSSSFGKEIVDNHINDQSKLYTTYENGKKTYNRNGYKEKLSPVDIESFVGTNLFENCDRKCLSSEDVALLAIRRDLETLVPKHLPESLYDDHTVALLINYFYITHQMVTGAASHRAKHLVQRAFYDTLGGYLHFKMVPVAKYSFYAGQISLSTANQVLLLHEECKKFLNTNGNGWKSPLQNMFSQLERVHIEPLHIPETDDGAFQEPSFCMQLHMNTEENQPDNDKMIVQLPKVEAENIKGYLGNIWLPFRRKRTFDLKLESSNYIVAKFYETVTKCYRFENIDQQYFNEKFKTWLMENINVHLSDEEFYPGLGAVLRIAEFLKRNQQQVLSIDKDVRMMLNIDENLNKYRRYKTKHDPAQNRNKLKNRNASKKAAEEKVAFPVTVPTAPKSPELLLRTLGFSTSQITLIAITVTAFVLLVLVCCWKCLCKNKKTLVEIKPVKHSDSSSSNLFNSPVRFFHIRKKSASNISAYASNERNSKKNNKSVKIDKRPLLASDTSASSSPSRKLKSKESQGSKSKGKGQGQSNVQ